MNFVSLFAGIGGFDLGLERAGMTCVGQCEIDPHAHAVLERHWPNVPKHDDVTTLEAGTFGPADVVTFGSPCQDLSVAGKRAGLDGERSGLFLEAVRYIREMLEETNGAYPRVAVWENVPGAYSSNDGNDFAAVLASLVGGEVRRPSGGWANAGVAFGPLGSAEWRTLNSQYFGVAQRRRRIFLIYHPRGEGAGAVLLEPDSLRGDIAEGRAAGEGATGSAAVGIGAYGLSGELDADHELIGTLLKGSPTGGGNPPMVANALTAREGKGPDSDATTTLVPVAFAQNQRDEVRDLKGVAGAIAAEPGMKQQTFLSTGYAVRRLTPRECERLQGFPDDWTAHDHEGREIADTHRYRMLGNAVTVSVVEWIAGRIKAVAA